MDEEYPGIWLPATDKDGDRRYDNSNLNPRGTPENPTRCIAEIARGSWHMGQCSRPRGHGPNELLCKLHAKKVEEAKDRERKEDDKR